MTYCYQSKSGPSTIYSPHDIRCCPIAQKSFNIGWKRKFQLAEILTRSPVEKQQRDKSEKKVKQKVQNLSTNLARSFSADNSAQKTQSTHKPRYFCQVCEDPCTEPPKKD
jgi:hypothetical protein